MNSHRFSLILVCVALAVPLILPCLTANAETVFERVFKTPQTFDKERVEEVLALKPGTRLPLDTNNDGKTDEVWYVDTSPRHTKNPILVRAVDEDGDMHTNGRPDRDSDLYFWDWFGDGTIDSVIDYVDDDGDNDLDQMGIFYKKNWKDKKDDLTVWWAVDIGDDNLLWYDVNGTYIQSLCQWRTHFSGDELFYQFRLTADDDKWVNVWEDPFAFYDPDGDLCSEEVVRISAVGGVVKNLRYSIDADNDAAGRRTHDYDFSITALAPEGGIDSQEWNTDIITIRDIPSHPVLPWDKTKEFAQTTQWDRAMLTWDEINSNTDKNPENNQSERWEGVLNHASLDGSFPQVGGPPSSDKNKRVEIATRPPTPLRLYYDESDRRLHLLGASEGYLIVDYNFDGKDDAVYRYYDDTGDGVFDRRTIDVDADGTVDFDWPMSGNSKEFPLEWSEIAPFYMGVLEESISDQRYFFWIASQSEVMKTPFVQELYKYFWRKLHEHLPNRQVGERICSSLAGQRYYGDSYQDRLLHLLKGNFRGRRDWNDAENAYQAGNTVLAAGYISRMLRNQEPSNEIPKRMVILHSAPPPSFTEDFVQFPFQSSFELNQRLTNAVLDHPAYVAWESDMGAYRCYTGQFDFFGKHQHRILKREDQLVYPLMDVDYHTEQEWGIDALHVGTASGLGGLTLYDDDKVYLVQSPAGEGIVDFTYEALASGWGQTAAQITARNVLPHAPDAAVQIICTIYAGHQESLIVVTLPEECKGMDIAPGVQRLPEKEDRVYVPEHGILGTWGYQGDDIGEIGLGVMVDPKCVKELIELDDEERIRCRVDGNTFRYWIIGDWRRGMQYPVAPTVDNWKRRLIELSDELLTTTPS